MQTPDPPMRPVFPPWFRLTALGLACVLVVEMLMKGNDPGNGGLFPAPWDKVVHFCFYATVAGLLALASDLRRPVAVWAVTVAVGVLDEWIQTMVPTRVADLGDLAMDALGALVAVTLYRALVLRRLRLR